MDHITDITTAASAKATISEVLWDQRARALAAEGAGL